MTQSDHTTEYIADLQADRDKLTADRDALLQALKRYSEVDERDCEFAKKFGDYGDDAICPFCQADAAIKQAEQK